ncbi:MAG: biopolymer transporter ExbD [Rhodocyclales bacterium]|nr:biopolymer transporter ExbD [Rhodocyclales bacterium]
MGMHIGSGNAGGEPEVMAEINTTPLIDVMLVLLIMLIITIPIQLHSVNLNMPAGNPPPPLVKPEVVRIDIDAGGSIRWNGEAVASQTELGSRLQAAAAQPVQPELHVRPNKSVAYKAVAYVLAEVQRRGLTKIGVAGGDQLL